MDFANLPTRNAEPNAAVMVQTFRAYGYNPETAVADLVDNSISAGARNVDVDFHWDGLDSWLAITDNGTGMDEEELINAMRPGSKNPESKREPGDLGRFGLGLKTASFSQCRRLTIFSRKPDQPLLYWTWDLDYVQQHNRWEIIRFPIPAFLSDKLNSLTQGTVVLWEKMDKLVSADTDSVHGDFLSTGNRIKQHLGMVFHRYIEKGKLTLTLNARIIPPWNPFLPAKQGTQPLSEESLQRGEGMIKGYILPHKSKLSETEFTEGGGLYGWNQQQGFYVYRNERLLVAGSWLGLGTWKKEEHTKLARIMVDITNDADADWQIDIKKSSATPPHGVKGQLYAYAQTTRDRAIEVYKQRGRKILQRNISVEFQPFWNERKRQGKYSYQINREHPLIQDFITLLPPAAGPELNKLLHMIEETIPMPLIMMREREEPESVAKPFDGEDTAIIALAKTFYQALQEKGYSAADAKDRLGSMEPFSHFPQIFEILN